MGFFLKRAYPGHLGLLQTLLFSLKRRGIFKAGAGQDPFAECSSFNPVGACCAPPAPSEGKAGGQFDRRLGGLQTLLSGLKRHFQNGGWPGSFCSVTLFISPFLWAPVVPSPSPATLGRDSWQVGRLWARWACALWPVGDQHGVSTCQPTETLVGHQPPTPSQQVLSWRRGESMPWSASQPSSTASKCSDCSAGGVEVGTPAETCPPKTKQGGKMKEQGKLGGGKLCTPSAHLWLQACSQPCMGLCHT